MRVNAGRFVAIAVSGVAGIVALTLACSGPERPSPFSPGPIGPVTAQLEPPLPGTIDDPLIPPPELQPVAAVIVLDAGTIVDGTMTGDAPFSGDAMP